MSKDNKYKTLFYMLYDAYGKEIKNNLNINTMTEIITINNNEVQRNILESPENVDIFVEDNKVVCLLFDKDRLVLSKNTKLNNIKNWRLEENGSSLQIHEGRVR